MLVLRIFSSLIEWVEGELKKDISKEYRKALIDTLDAIQNLLKFF